MSDDNSNEETFADLHQHKFPQFVVLCYGIGTFNRCRTKWDLLSQRPQPHWTTQTSATLYVEKIIKKVYFPQGWHVNACFDHYECSNLSF